ncbi:uncharacterized protein TNCV_4859561 [Trichonephila clavipes]|nr:uncharacterized protein TNCV_4859561 [Trichonephila clavipes]
MFLSWVIVKNTKIKQEKKAGANSARSPKERRQAVGSLVVRASDSRQEGLATRGLLATDHVILNHGQVTWTTPELAPPLLTTTPHQREDVSALDRFNVHRCPTRRVFSGTGLEPVTKQATFRYQYHSATAARQIIREASKNLFVSAITLANDVASTSGVQICAQSVQNALHDALI